MAAESSEGVAVGVPARARHDTVALPRPLSRVGALDGVWAAGLAALVSTSVGLYQLGQPSLWVDEAATYRATTWSLARLTHEHHWLYYTLMKPWTALAGTSEVALRLPSVAAAAAACALLVPLGNRLLGKPIGALAGLALALNPFFVQWSQQARSYTIVTLAAIAATWTLLDLRDHPTRRTWLLYTLALTTSVLLQPLSAGLLATSHLLAARGARRNVALAGLAVTISTSIYLAGVYIRDSESGTLVWNVDPSLRYLSQTVAELSGAYGVGLALALVGLAVVTRERLLLASWALTPLVAALAVTPVANVFVDRYLIVSAPAFALLVGVAVAHLRRWWRAGAVTAFAAATIAGLAIWYSPDGSQNWVGEDWKAATRYAMQHGGALAYPPWTAGPAYEYYGGVERKTGLYVLWTIDERDFAGGWPVDVSFGERLRVQRRP